jgi:hypothetical protein
LLDEWEWNVLKTEICQEDCLLGRQIESLEKKMDRELTSSPNYRIRKSWKKAEESNRKFEQKLKAMGLERQADGRYIRGKIREKRDNKLGTDTKLNC